MAHKNLKATAFPYQIEDERARSNFQYYDPMSGECNHPYGVEVLEVIYFGKEAKSSYTIARLSYMGRECLGVRWNIGLAIFKVVWKGKIKAVCFIVNLAGCLHFRLLVRMALCRMRLLEI